MEVCKHCGEDIHQNTFDGIWRHWDGYRKCSDSEKLAEPGTPNNVELGGHHD